MTCIEADLLIAARAVGSLDPNDLPVLEEHLTECERCRRAASDYAAVAALLPMALEPQQPPPSLRTRVLTQVYGPAVSVSRTTRLRVRLRGLWRAVPASRAATLAVTTAAVVALGLFTWSLTARQTGAPAPVAIHVHGTTEAPAASGTLTYDASTAQSVLTVAGLDVPTSARGIDAYEVWLIRPDGSVVAAAFLTLSPDGHTWSAVIRGDLHRYTAIAATIEPPGGSRSPSGPEVIRTVVPVI